MVWQVGSAGWRGSPLARFLVGRVVWQVGFLRTPRRARPLIWQVELASGFGPTLHLASGNHYEINLFSEGADAAETTLVHPKGLPRLRELLGPSAQKRSP